MKPHNSTAQDIERIALQEKILRFPHFDNTSAWNLGNRIKDACTAKNVAVSIEVRLGCETIFFYAMTGTAPTNADWARRKRNTCELMHRSSYGVGLSLALEGGSLEKNMGLPTRDYASHGGSFPIQVIGVGYVGTVTISGLPQREDHSIIVEVLADLFSIPLHELTFNS